MDKLPTIQHPLIEFEVKLAMTHDQWNQWLRHYGVRQMSCEIGLDSPQIQDLVAFQIVRQLREQGHTASASENRKLIQNAKKASNSASKRTGHTLTRGESLDSENDR